MTIADDNKILQCTQEVLTKLHLCAVGHQTEQTRVVICVHVYILVVCIVYIHIPQRWQESTERERSECYLPLQLPWGFPGCRSWSGRGCGPGWSPVPGLNSPPARNTYTPFIHKYTHTHTHTNTHTRARTHTHTHTHTHAHTHEHTHAHMRTHTHTQTKKHQWHT